nr:MAG: RNA-dependent RNA polymerase [Rovyktys virus]
MSQAVKDTRLDSALSNTVLKRKIECYIQDTMFRPKQPYSHQNNIKDKEFFKSLNLDSKTEFYFNPQVQTSYLLETVEQMLLPVNVKHELDFFFKITDNVMLPTLKILNLHQFSSLPVLSRLMEKVRDHVNYDVLLKYYFLNVVFERGVILTARPEGIQQDQQFYPGCLEYFSDYDWKDIKLESGQIIFTNTSLPQTKIVLSNDFFCLQDGVRVLHLGVRHHFLCLADIFSQRFTCLLKTILMDLLSKIEFPKPELLLSIYKWGDDILKKFGNQGYKSVKCWEPIIMSEILVKSEELLEDQIQFQNEMHTSFIETGSTPDERKWLKNHLRSLVLSILNETPISVLFEIHGIYRQWGHPSINEIHSMYKLRSSACRHMGINHWMVHTVHMKFREIFCLKYHHKNKCWPKFSIPNKKPNNSYLIDCLEKGISISTQQPEYNIDHWKFIKFEKTMQMPNRYDLHDLLSDKSTSSGLVDLIKNLDKNESIGSSQSRSVLLQWLNSPYISPAQLFEKIDEFGFDKNEILIGMVPKELEMGLDARMFGLLPFEKRMYTVLKERIIADCFLDYFKEITMTYDAVSLKTRSAEIATKMKNNQTIINKLKQTDAKSCLRDSSVSNTRESQQINFSNSSGVHLNAKSDIYTSSVKKHRVFVKTSLDFLKWNSHKRKEENIKIFRDMDNLLGFDNVISRTHELFEKCFVYLANNSVLPEIDKDTGLLKENDICWLDHLGGVEGLNQKGWTVETVIHLILIAEHYKVKIEIMGQGDNQILLIEYHITDKYDLREQHKHFLAGLSKVFSNIGPPLKPEETWSSTSICFYGKEGSYKGIDMAMSLKKIAKLSRLTNEGLLTPESVLSSIAANTTAAISASMNCEVPLIISTLQSAGTLFYHLNLPFFHNVSFIQQITKRKKQKFVIPDEGNARSCEFTCDPILLKWMETQHVNFYTLLLLLPSHFGGYPVLTLPQAILRGFPDPVVASLWFSQQLINVSEMFDDEIIPFLSRILIPCIAPTRSSELLCSDPTSINPYQGSNANDKVKKILQEVLFKNKTFKNELFQVFCDVDSINDKKLSDLLMEMRPNHPRVSSSILDLTLTKKAESILAKVAKAKTVITLALKLRYETDLKSVDIDGEVFDLQGKTKDYKSSLSSQISRFQLNTLSGILHNLTMDESRVKSKFLETNCSVKRSRILRREAWGMEIEGVSVAFPLELLVPLTSYRSNCVTDEHLNPHLGYVETILCGSDEYPLSKFGCSGPYLAFFGTSTSEKVEYIGKKISLQGPPLLRNIFDMIKLINWGTEENSNLSNLIIKLGETFTDLPLRQFIPAIDCSGGSVGHRFNDLRVSHSSSPAVRTSIGSYLHFNVNFFNPQKAIDPEPPNVNIFIQALYSSLHYYTSVHTPTLSFLPKENLVNHWHVNCIDCIEKINEETIECPEFEDKLNSLYFKQHKDSPYLFCSADQLQIQSGSYPNYGRLRSLSDLDPRLYPTILSKSIIYWIFQTSLPYSLETLNHIYVPTSRVFIPVSVGSKLKAKDFFHHLSLAVFLYFSYINHNAGITGSSGIDIWLNSVISQVSNLNSGWFFIFISLYIDGQFQKECRDEYPGLLPPVGQPPSDSSKAFYYMDILRTEMTREDFKRNLSKNLLQWVSSPTSYSKQPWFHPIWIYGMRLLISEAEIEQSEGQLILFSMKKWRESKEEEVPIFNNSDFVSDNYEGVKEQGWLSLIKCLSAITPMTTFCNCSSDGIMKLMVKQRPRNWVETKDEGNYPNLTWDSIKKLPQAASQIYVMKNINHRRSSSTIINEYSYLDPQNIILFDHKKSFITHLIKPNSPLTTAAYKPVSIFNYLLRQGIVSLNYFKSIFRVVCTGDGQGGYSHTLGSLCPQAEIFYNTLFSVSKLGSTNTDAFYPSTIFSTPSIAKRIHGLNLVREGKSDLTNKIHINLLLKEVKTSQLVICDAEGSGVYSPEVHLKILSNVISLSLKAKSDLIILKMYASNSVLAWAVYNQMYNRYQKVYCLRSHYSTQGNTEFFMVGVFIQNKSQGRKQHFFVDESSKKIKGDFCLNNYCFQEFLSSFQRPDIYVEIPIKHNLLYSELMENSITRLKWYSQTNQQILLFKRYEKFRFPDDLILSLRKTWNLIQITKGKKRFTKENYLSDRLKTQLCYMCIKWAACCLYPLRGKSDLLEIEFKLLESFIDKVYFVIYESLDGNWSFNFSTVPRDLTYDNYKNAIWFRAKNYLSEMLVKALFQEIGLDIYYSTSLACKIKTRFHSFSQERVHDMYSFSFDSSCSEEESLSKLKNLVLPLYLSPLLRKELTCNETWVHTKGNFTMINKFFVRNILEVLNDPSMDFQYFLVNIANSLELPNHHQFLISKDDFINNQFYWKLLDVTNKKKVKKLLKTDWF